MRLNTWRTPEGHTPLSFYPEVTQLSGKNSPSPQNTCGLCSNLLIELCSLMSWTELLLKTELRDCQKTLICIMVLFLLVSFLLSAETKGQGHSLIFGESWSLQVRCKCVCPWGMVTLQKRRFQKKEWTLSSIHREKAAECPHSDPTGLIQSREWLLQVPGPWTQKAWTAARLPKQQPWEMVPLQEWIVQDTQN